MQFNNRYWQVALLAGLVLALGACQSSDAILSEGTAAPNPVPAAGSKDTLFYDDFSNPSSGWPVDDSYYFRGYDEGTYLIRIDQDENPYIFPTAVSGHSFSDVRVEVDAIRVSGSETAGVYLICRRQDNDNYYYAELDGEGTLSAGAFLDDKQTILVDDFPTDVEVDQNHLQLDCVGTKMIVYLDGVQMLYVSNLEILQGDVGFGAGGSGRDVTAVRFDNFKVSEP